MPKLGNVPAGNCQLEVPVAVVADMTRGFGATSETEICCAQIPSAMARANRVMVGSLMMVADR